MSFDAERHQTRIRDLNNSLRFAFERNEKFWENPEITTAGDEALKSHLISIGGLARYVPEDTVLKEWYRIVWPTGHPSYVDSTFKAQQKDFCGFMLFCIALKLEFSKGSLAGNEMASALERSVVTWNKLSLRYNNVPISKVEEVDTAVNITDEELAAMSSKAKGKKKEEDFTEVKPSKIKKRKADVHIDSAAGRNKKTGNVKVPFLDFNVEDLPIDGATGKFKFKAACGLKIDASENLVCTGPSFKREDHEFTEKENEEITTAAADWDRKIEDINDAFKDLAKDYENGEKPPEAAVAVFKNQIKEVNAAKRKALGSLKATINARRKYVMDVPVLYYKVVDLHPMHIKAFQESGYLLEKDYNILAPFCKGQMGADLKPSAREQAVNGFEHIPLVDYEASNSIIAHYRMRLAVLESRFEMSAVIGAKVNFVTKWVYEVTATKDSLFMDAMDTFLDSLEAGLKRVRTKKKEENWNALFKGFANAMLVTRRQGQTLSSYEAYVRMSLNHYYGKNASTVWKRYSEKEKVEGKSQMDPRLARAYQALVQASSSQSRTMEADFNVSDKPKTYAERASALLVTVSDQITDATRQVADATLNVATETINPVREYIGSTASVWDDVRLSWVRWKAYTSFKENQTGSESKWTFFNRKVKKCAKKVKRATKKVLTTLKYAAGATALTVVSAATVALTFVPLTLASTVFSVLNRNTEHFKMQYKAYKWISKAAYFINRAVFAEWVSNDTQERWAEQVSAYFRNW